MQCPDFTSFHESLTEELYAVKDRIRNLVTHWPTDGEYKEAALRSVLRRHLPSSFSVGRGFVVSKTGASTQVDVLVIDSQKPTLFKEGDLLIVTPDAVRAAIEVKTNLASKSDLETAIKKLMAVERVCSEQTDQDRCWTGLFSFNHDNMNHEIILNAISQSYAQMPRAINCISLGRNDFVRYWSLEDSVERYVDAPVWHSYSLPSIAPSYFIGNLIDSLTSTTLSAGYAWFPLVGGKEQHRKFYLAQGDNEVRRF